MSSVLQKLINNKWFTASKGDDCLQEFKQWIREVAKEESPQLSSFDKTKDRLDELYYRLIGAHEKYKALWEVVRMVLIMSHEQSTVERGFSTNKDILKTNMGKETLKAYRLVYDGLVNAPKMKTSRQKTSRQRTSRQMRQTKGISLMCH